MESFRRRGIGGRLLAGIENECKKRGITHFHLSTEADNTAALALYRSRGYVQTSVMLEKDIQP
jgi:ribosomal protein S18 acetylase RimI-like enzyme